VARFLGGVVRGPSFEGLRTNGESEPTPAACSNLQNEFATPEHTVEFRPVTAVDARQPKRLRLKVEVPVEDLAKLARTTSTPGGHAAQGPSAPSIWSSRSKRRRRWRVACSASGGPATGSLAGRASRQPERRGPTRQSGAGVIPVNGALAAYVGRADRQLMTFLPGDEPLRSLVAGEVARMLHALATGGSDRPGMLIAEIDGVAAASHTLASFLVEAGFTRRPTGFQAAPPRDG
jgi:hypothetical protein